MEESFSHVNPYLLLFLESHDRAPNYAQKNHLILPIFLFALSLKARR